MKKAINFLTVVFICYNVYSQATSNVKSETIIDQRTVHLNSTNNATFGGGASKTAIPIELPPNTIEWYYSFTTGGSKDASNNLQLGLQVASLISNLNLMGALLSSTGLEQKAISSIKIPEGSHAVNIYLFDRANYDNFLKDKQIRYIISGSVQNTTQAIVRVKNPNKGIYFLGISNPASIYAVNIVIEVVALVKIN